MTIATAKIAAHRRSERRPTPAIASCNFAEDEEEDAEGCEVVEVVMASSGKIGGTEEDVAAAERLALAAATVLSPFKSTAANKSNKEDCSISNSNPQTGSPKSSAAEIRRRQRLKEKQQLQKNLQKRQRPPPGHVYGLRTLLVPPISSKGVGLSRIVTSSAVRTTERVHRCLEGAGGGNSLWRNKEGMAGRVQATVLCPSSGYVVSSSSDGADGGSAMGTTKLDVEKRSDDNGKEPYSSIAAVSVRAVGATMMAQSCPSVAKGQNGKRGAGVTPGCPIDLFDEGTNQSDSNSYYYDTGNDEYNARNQSNVEQRKEKKKTRKGEKWRRKLRLLRGCLLGHGEQISTKDRDDNIDKDEDGVPAESTYAEPDSNGHQGRLAGENVNDASTTSPTSPKSSSSAKGMMSSINADIGHCASQSCKDDKENDNKKNEDNNSNIDYIRNKENTINSGKSGNNTKNRKKKKKKKKKLQNKPPPKHPQPKMIIRNGAIDWENSRLDDCGVVSRVATFIACSAIDDEGNAEGVPLTPTSPSSPFNSKAAGKNDGVMVSTTCFGATIFGDEAVIRNRIRPIDEMVCVDRSLGIYISESGLSVPDCRNVIRASEYCAQARGGWSSYTYAKQTLGCRENDQLAFVCARPVMTACATIRKHLAEDEEIDSGELENSCINVTMKTVNKKNGASNNNENRNNINNRCPSINNNTAPESARPPRKKKELVLDVREPHVVKYDTSRLERQKLDMHTDKSEWTFLIALTEGRGEDYRGGGTYFQAADCTVHLQRSQMLIFRGKLRHCGVAISGGCRYLLVGFLVPRGSSR